jgi:hypothetical protein
MLDVLRFLPANAGKLLPRLSPRGVAEHAPARRHQDNPLGAGQSLAVVR